MNNSALVLATDNRVIAVSAIFVNEKGWDNEDEDEDEIFSTKSKKRSAASKHYTYKTIDKTLKQGDLVVVECEGGSSQFGLAVVQIVEVDVDVDFKGSVNYKWVVSKVDTDTIKDVKQQEKEIIKKVKAAEKHHHKMQILQAITVNAEELKLLIKE